MPTFECEDIEQQHLALAGPRGSWGADIIRQTVLVGAWARNEQRCLGVGLQRAQLISCLGQAVPLSGVRSYTRHVRPATNGTAGGSMR